MPSLPSEAHVLCTAPHPPTAGLGLHLESLRRKQPEALAVGDHIQARAGAGLGCVKELLCVGWHALNLLSRATC